MSVGMWVVPSPAQAATCAFASNTATITYAAGNSVTISRGNSGEVMMNGVACSTATWANTNTVVTAGVVTGSETLVLDMSNGQFAPGFTDEAGNFDEPEWTIDLGTIGGATTDTISIIGCDASCDALTFANCGNTTCGFSSNDHIQYSTTQFSLNCAETTFDAEQTSANFYTNTEIFSLSGGDGDDILNTAALNGPTADAPDCSGATDLGTASAKQTIFDGGPGVDNMSAGTATTDRAEYVSATAGLTIIGQAAGTAMSTSTGDALNDTHRNIEVITGSGFDDTITGRTTADTINGGAGADTISGGTGTIVDTLNGDAGDDSLNGQAGADVENGGDDNDTFTQENVTNGGDTMNGGAGTDTVDYSSRTTLVTVTLDGTANDGQSTEVDDVEIDVENVSGSSANDSITGNASTDNVLSGNGGDDTLLSGLGGADTLSGGGGADASLSGGDGNDTITGGAGDDTITGGNGDDTITGGADNDTESGDADNDTFVQGSDAEGNDTLNGGAGTDTADYSSRVDAIDVDIDNVADDGRTAGTIETDDVGGAGKDVENITGGSGDDLLIGDLTVSNTQANVLTGNAGDDTLTGGPGADTFSGGAPVMDGTQAALDTGDTVDYSASATAVTVNLTTNAASGGDAASDVFSASDGIENIVGSNTAASADVLTGDASINVLTGGLGNDTLAGGTNDDELFGGANDDTMNGDAGYDTLAPSSGTDTVRGGADNDTLDYSSSTVGVTVDLSITTAQGGAGDSINDTYPDTDIENVVGSETAAQVDTLTGTSTANILVGGPGADVLSGGDGNDILSGQAGADTLNGGGGNDDLSAGNDSAADTLDGGTGTDTANYIRCLAGVTLDLTVTSQPTVGCGTDSFTNMDSLRGSGNADTLTGDGSSNAILGGGGGDTINGGGAADILSGARGGDTINGEGGNDVLDGGIGTDVLDGGAGTDSCVNGETVTTCE